MAFVLLTGAALQGPAAAQLVGDIYFLPTEPTAPAAAAETIRAPVFDRAPIDGLRDVEFAPDRTSYKVTNKPIWTPSLPGAAAPTRASPDAAVATAATAAGARPPQAEAGVPQLPGGHAATFRNVPLGQLRRQTPPTSPPPEVRTVGVVPAAAAARETDRPEAAALPPAPTPSAGEAGVPTLSADAGSDGAAPRRSWWRGFTRPATRDSGGRIPVAAAPTKAKLGYADQGSANLAPPALQLRRPGVSTVALSDRGNRLETIPAQAGAVPSRSGLEPRPISTASLAPEPVRVAAAPVARAPIVVGASGPPRIGAPRPATPETLPPELKQHVSHRGADLPAINAVRPVDEPSPDGITFHNPFGPCAGRCGILVNAGVFADGLNFDDSGMVALSISRPVVSFGNVIEIGPEIGIAQRFGDATSTEVWGAMYLRYHAFPWDRHLDTSISVAAGVNYAFEIDRLEDRIDPNDPLDHLLGYIAPEIAVSHPKLPGAEFVLRMHHRTGLGGAFPGTDTDRGATYVGAGVRWKF